MTPALRLVVAWMVGVVAVVVALAAWRGQLWFRDTPVASPVAAASPAALPSPAAPPIPSAPAPAPIDVIKEIRENGGTVHFRHYDHPPDLGDLASIFADPDASAGDLVSPRPQGARSGGGVPEP